jgi:VIT1/CCC1 family predicted Fe2+/Mn2+ transporter
MKAGSGRIHLDGVEINSAGPIGSFRAELAPLTVVYARNERGKTTIVENLVACLFRQRKGGMQLRRDFIGASRVTVKGISKKPATFTSLAGRRKIDDLIETLGWPFPPSLFDLLVVKGAELEILGQQGGLTRSYLKSLVTAERLYETLRDRLPSEIGYTELKEGILIPKRRIGAYKTYEETQSHLSSLETLAGQFYGSLSRTELLAGLCRKAALQREQEQLQLAKRHAAYLLHRKTGELAAQLERFDEEQAEHFSDTIKETLRTRAELAEIEKEDRRQEKTLSDLRWLEEVRRRYEQVSSSRRNPLQMASFLAAGASLMGALAVYFFAPDLLPVILIVTLLCFTLALLFTFVVRRVGNPESARAEIQEIRSAFQERFGTPLSTPADFALIKSRLDRELGKVQGMEEKHSAAHAALKSLHEQVRELLRAADRSGVPESQWGELSEELKTRTRQLRIDYNLARQRLGDLGIDELDYLEQAVETSYSRRREEEIVGELEQVEATIREQQDSSRELRERLIEHIGRETALSESIEVLAEAIEEKKREYRRQMRERLAEMIAGHVLAEVLESFLELENQQLKSTLNDPRITDLIKRFTAGKYEAVSLEDGGLFVENETESYALEEMSSGAREQVLLAVRMGLASVVCGRQNLFLILDDAFQYSDWQRREQLVLQAVQIVQSGWQVIYLTMDDDIRDRFCAGAAALDEGMFRLIEL